MDKVERFFDRNSTAYIIKEETNRKNRVIHRKYDFPQVFHILWIIIMSTEG
ncbi:MAG: hypothetical protein IJH99_03945 [Eubacterium sp.]|nr:hypothetical protein [Eubacterium sp.]